MLLQSCKNIEIVLECADSKSILECCSKISKPSKSTINWTWRYVMLPSYSLDLIPELVNSLFSVRLSLGGLYFLTLGKKSARVDACNNTLIVRYF